MISSFQGPHRFLSNFWPSPVVYGGAEYATVEHAYQAAKTLVPAEREIVRTAPTAASAKRRGRGLRLRHDWEAVKLRVMEECVRLKFADPELRAMLLATGDEELVEGNAWGDDFWGCVQRGGTWRGGNHLGKILMRVRGELR